MAVAVRPATLLGGVVSRARGRDGRGPIGLNLGEGQRAAVDPDFVEQAAERYCCRAGCRASRRGPPRPLPEPGRRGDQCAIHIDLERIGAVRERHGDMVPVRIGDRAGEGVAGTERAEGQLVVGLEVEFFTAHGPRGRRALAEEMPLAPAQDVAFGPEFNREIGGAEVIGRRIGDRDGIVDALKRQGLAIGGLARDPRGPVHQRSGMTGPGRIRHGRPAPLVHAIQ